MANCPHRSEDIKGHIFADGLIAYVHGVCDLCNELVSLQWVDWERLAWSLWNEPEDEPERI